MLHQQPPLPHAIGQALFDGRETSKSSSTKEEEQSAAFGGEEA